MSQQKTRQFGEDEYYRAADRYTNGKVIEAEEVLRQAIEKYPEHP